MPKQFVKKKSAQEIGLADAFLFQRSGNRGKYAIPFRKVCFHSRKVVPRIIRLP
jgi:hypothetical protein